MTSKINLTFLGTSSDIPTSRRNHTAVLLNYGGENILVDCGEGVQRQFRKAKLNPCRVNRILITHRHGDHVFGLPGLISTLNHSSYNRTLHIYCPRRTKRFIENFLGMDFTERGFEVRIEEVSGKFFENDDFYLEAESMEHGIPTNAYNFVLKDKVRIDKKKLAKAKLPQGRLIGELKNGKNITHEGKKYSAKNLTYTEKGKKVSFVLDTLDNKRIVPFVRNADLLICEASFSSANAKEAREHLHLTAGQAGRIAKKAKVGKLILTHISQRYDKNIKELLDDAKKEFGDVRVAEDFDREEI